MPDFLETPICSWHRTKSLNGVAVATLDASDFGGEHERKSLPYLASLWAVSALAAATNVVRAHLAPAARNDGRPLRKRLWDMGRDPQHISSLFVDRFSRFNHQAKYGAAGWRSLDLFYNYHEKVTPALDHNLEGALTRYWMGMANRQAVTNRLKIVVNLLTDAFAEFAHEPEIRILSLASGSAQAVITAMLRCPQLNVRVVLIDNDETAIEEAKKNASQAGLADRFAFVCGATSQLEDVCAGCHPHIIEMVGFLDYRPTAKAIELIRRIRDSLPDGGIFITSNVRGNLEKPFLDWVLLWPMIYRTEEELAELLVEGGFAPANSVLIYEPFKIHGVAISRRYAYLDANF